MRKTAERAFFACASHDETIFNVRVSVPEWVDASIVSDVLLDFGFMSTTVSLDGPENHKRSGAYVYTDDDFDRTGQVDLRSQRDACVEALSSTAVNAPALRETLAEMFGDGPWIIQSKPLECGGTSDSAMRLEENMTQATQIAVGGAVMQIEHGNYAAFGDGGHSSTRLCLQQLERLDLRFANVLDFGCGTGVLGLAALSLGAQHATLVENDPASLAIAADNIKSNGQWERIELMSSLRNSDSAVRFDVVVANLPANTLMGVMPELVRALTSPRGPQAGSPRSRHLVLAGFPEREGTLVRGCLLQVLSEVSSSRHEHAEIAFEALHEAGKHPLAFTFARDHAQHDSCIEIRLSLLM